MALIKFEGKALEKLIDVISKGIGDWRRPNQIRKEADAEAYKIKVIEKARSEAIAQAREIEADSIGRVQQRIIQQELRRQDAIDNIIMEAAKELEGSEVSEEQVSPDWAIRFFNHAQDITDEDMQLLWAKILAGETQKPKSFSLRTLELLKNLSKEEANKFIKVAQFATVDQQLVNFLYFDDTFFDKIGITHLDRIYLDEIGLLNLSSSNILGKVKGDQESIDYIMNHCGIGVS